MRPKNNSCVCLDCRICSRFPATYFPPHCNKCGARMVRVNHPPKKSDDKAWKSLELQFIHKVRSYVPQSYISNGVRVRRPSSLAEVRQRVREVRRERSRREMDPVNPSKYQYWRGGTNWE